MSIYPPTGTLEIKNATLKIPVVDLQYTSNTAKLEANSNVVTEFSRSKKLIKYPRVALTQNALNNGYTVIQSGTNGSEHRKAWTLFNNDVTTDDQYHAVADVASGETNPYNYVSGAYEPDAGFEDGLGDVAGEYVYVEMPDKIKLQGVSVHPRDGALNRSAESARFMGSNNGTTWIDLGGYTNYVWASGSQEPGNFFTVESNEYYNYIGVVWTKVKGGSGGDTVNMAEVQFFGVPEYDPEADGTDVVVKSVPNVPNTDWLEVYYDAKNYTSGVVQDETSNDIDATIGAATTFDSVNKAWSFSGASNRDGTEFVSGYLPSDFEGNQIHSVSMWLKFDYWHDGAFCIIGKNTRTNSDNHKAIHFQFQDTSSARPRILYDFWDNQKSFYLPDDVQPGKWLHMTATYTGNAALRKMFVNGQELTTFTTNSNYATALALDTTNDLVVRLGSRFPVNSSYIFHGDIANFRLFNRALTSDEVWQLYAHQKEYFGLGDLSMTLKAGRLGIGTSEPRAALDVRGDVHISGSLRKTRAQMFARSSGSMGTNTISWVTLAPYGEIWTAYSENPLFSVHITGDYTDTTGREIYFRLIVRNERTREVVYFPSSSGWLKYLYIDHSRLDGHGYNGIMSNLTPGDSYTSGLEVNGNHASSYYRWSSAYGTLTGIVWD